MKKLLYIVLVLFFCSISLFGTERKLSSIPPPKNIMIDLDPYECNKGCLENYLQKGMPYSFLAKYSKEETSLKNEYDFFRQEAWIGEPNKKYVKIAFLVPHKTISRYAASSINAAISYLFYQGNDFEFELFDCDIETEANIKEQVQKITQKGYSQVIAPLTPDGALILANMNLEPFFYIPTVNKKAVNIENKNILYGGIDYEAQIDKLLEYAQNRVAVFDDGTKLGLLLLEYTKKYKKDIEITNFKIDNSKINFEKLFKQNSKINDSSILLNTPLVKSSLIASQLRFYQIYPEVILSTQINYNPAILYLTQYQDRKNMLLANSISIPSFAILEYAKLLENNIEFDWITYSATLGADYLLNKAQGFLENRIFGENIVGGQVEYEIKIEKPTFSKFER